MIIKIFYCLSDLSLSLSYKILLKNYLNSLQKTFIECSELAQGNSCSQIKRWYGGFYFNKNSDPTFD